MALSIHQLSLLLAHNCLARHHAPMLTWLQPNAYILAHARIPQPVPCFSTRKAGWMRRTGQSCSPRGSASAVEWSLVMSRPIAALQSPAVISLVCEPPPLFQGCLFAARSPGILVARLRRRQKASRHPPAKQSSSATSSRVSRLPRALLGAGERHIRPPWPLRLRLAIRAQRLSPALPRASSGEW